MAKEPAWALGDVTPLQYADTELGAQEVEDLLGRIEHGVLYLMITTLENSSAANLKDKAYAGDGAPNSRRPLEQQGCRCCLHCRQAVALASIEMIVNLPAPKLLQKYVRISARINSDLVSAFV